MIKFVGGVDKDTLIVPTLVITDKYVELRLNDVSILSVGDLGVYLSQAPETLARLGLPMMNSRIKARDLYNSNL